MVFQLTHLALEAGVGSFVARVRSLVARVRFLIRSLRSISFSILSSRGLLPLPSLILLARLFPVLPHRESSTSSLGLL